jgi:hypothetical protein
MSDLRDKILSASKKNLTPLEVPEWGCTVYISSLSARDFNRLVNVLKSAEVPDDFFARFVYLCACDESGIRIFNEGDIEAIQEMDADPVKRIAMKAQEVNGFSESPEALAEKNSDTTQDGC